MYRSRTSPASTRFRTDLVESVLQIATREEGPVATTSPARIDDDLYASAKAAGRAMSRSASQQIAHWARIGRELEAGRSVSLRAIGDVVAGDAGYDTLSPEEQAVVRAEWAERIEARIASLDLGTALAAEGRPYAELKEAGVVVVHEPTTSTA